MKRKKGTKLVLYCENIVVELDGFPKVRAVARKLIERRGVNNIFVFCMTCFFSNQIKFRQDMNI